MSRIEVVNKQNKKGFKYFWILKGGGRLKAASYIEIAVTGYPTHWINNYRGGNRNAEFKAINRRNGRT